MFVVVSHSQPAADKVKEVTAFSRECLEKIERSRVEKNYQEVQNTALSFSSFHFGIAGFLPVSIFLVCPRSGCQVVS